MKLLKSLLAGLVMVAFDLAGFVLCFFFAYVLRLTVLMNVVPTLSVPLSFETFAQRWYLLLVYVLVFAYEGLYTKRLVLREEMRRILRAVVLSTALVIMALYVTRAYVLSRSVVLLAMILSFLVVPVFRTIAKQLVIVLRLWVKSVVVVGLDRNAQVLRVELTRNWRLGYVVAGLVDPQELMRSSDEGLRELLRRLRAESYVLSDASVGREAAARLLRPDSGSGDDVMILLDSTALRSSGVEVEQLESLLLMKFRYNLLLPVNAALKRVLEVAATLTLLLLLAPLMGLIALVVKLSSPGSVLFAQQRIGRNRRLFRCLKFRTMWHDADQRLERMLERDPQLRAEWMKFSRIPNDPRVTRVGRFLRRFSLDELPQFWNVLRGEMSLVGPRPYMPREIEKIGPFLDVIARVRPGLTGQWQVAGRKEVAFDERLLLDEHYVKNWSLWMDLVILLRTVRVVLRGEGAA